MSIGAVAAAAAATAAAAIDTAAAVADNAASLDGAPNAGATSPSSEDGLHEAVAHPLVSPKAEQSDEAPNVKAERFALI